VIEIEIQPSTWVIRMYNGTILPSAKSMEGFVRKLCPFTHEKLRSLTLGKSVNLLVEHFDVDPKFERIAWIESMKKAMLP